MTGNIQNIIVIESLGKKNSVNFSGESLYNDFIKNRIIIYEKEIFHKFHKVENINQFFAVIENYISNSSFMPSGIVIHLEMHGDKELKGLIFSNGSLIKWEQLVDLFRKINVMSCNNLFITMGTCNGRYLYRGVKAEKKSPYSAYISASIEVSQEEVYTKFGKLFEELITCGNIVESYLKIEKTKSNFFFKDSETTFEEAFESTMQKFTANSVLREQMLNKSIELIKLETGVNIYKEDADLILKIATENIYKKYKKAFDFTTCK